MARQVAVQLSIDTTAATQEWTAAQAALADVPDLVRLARDAASTISITATAADADTVDFSTNSSIFQSRLADLQSKLAVAQADLQALMDMLVAGLPVTVTQVG